jgi:hypothetical protein
VPMLGGPPQDTLLSTRLRKKCENKLKCPAGRVSAVGEIPVIAGSDRKNPEPIQRHTKDDCGPADSRPQRAEAGQMDQHKRYSRRIDDVVDFDAASGHVRVSHSSPLAVSRCRTASARLQTTDGFHATNATRRRCANAAGYIEIKDECRQTGALTAQGQVVRPQLDRRKIVVI